MGLPDFQMFANRLQKMQRHIGKIMRRQDVSCYRIYDADLPEFPLAVDRYGQHLHVAEYQRKHSLTPEEYELWWQHCRQVLETALETPPAHIFYKKREQQRGVRQYEKFGGSQKEIIVEEGGLKFIVNLSDYLDTGLFLDHRITRDMVRKMAAGKQVLNLFAYTGSFSVYAAAGGARSVTTIDLSNTYLQWAKRNFEVNAISTTAHDFVRADVKEWLRQASAKKFDLVILDPPTFSNSKKMPDVLDVQEDQAFLINQCLKKMNPGGVLFFSTNFRKFKIDVENIKGASIKDISAQTIPADFRNKKIHYCFEIIKH